MRPTHLEGRYLFTQSIRLSYLCIVVNVSPSNIHPPTSPHLPTYLTLLPLYPLMERNVVQHLSDYSLLLHSSSSEEVRPCKKSDHVVWCCYTLVMCDDVSSFSPLWPRVWSIHSWTPPCSFFTFDTCPKRTEPCRFSASWRKRVVLSHLTGYQSLNCWLEGTLLKSQSSEEKNSPCVCHCLHPITLLCESSEAPFCNPSTCDVWRCEWNTIYHFA